MMHIRFDNQNRVVGWWGDIGLDAAEITLDFVAANNKRIKRTKTTENISAYEKHKRSMNL